MTIIGFDVSKDELVGVRINQRAAVQASFTIPNSPAAIDEFLDRLAAEHLHVTVTAESTGEYHRLLALACLAHGIPFRMLNPITVKQFTRATVRKKKTDPSDALSIAKLGLQGAGRLLKGELFPRATLVSRTANKLGRMDQMLHLMSQRLERHFPQETGLQDELAAVQAAMAALIGRLRAQVVAACDPTTLTLLKSLPGVGSTLASTFMAEIQNVERFPSGNELIAFAGLDPRIRQSGYSLQRNTRLTKRGSPFLRRAAYIAAQIAERHDPELTAYFEKKMNEGKRYTEATVSVARKILYRVYAVWKRGTPYVPKPLPT